MRIQRGVVAAVIVQVLAGCAGAGARMPVVPALKDPQPGVGYAGCLFEYPADGSRGYGLVLADVRGGREFVLWTDFTPDRESDMALSLVPLPPGRYRIAAWLTFNGYSKEILSRRALPAEHALAGEFDVRAGHVALLGQWRGRTSTAHPDFRTERTSMSLVTAEAHRELAAAKLARDHPGFAGLPLQCLGCAATLHGKASLPLSAGRQALLTEAVVNGVRGRFVVDGSVRLVAVRAAFAERFRPAPLVLARQSVLAQDGALVVPRQIWLDQLQLQDLAGSDVEAEVMDGLPDGVDGVLGLPFLVHLTVRTDRDGGRLELSAP